MPFPAKVKLCTESLQSWTRCKGQARLSTTSQALRASSPSRGASGEEAKLYGMPRPPLARGGGIASAMTERLDEDRADGSRAVSTKKEDPFQSCSSGRGSSSW